MCGWGECTQLTRESPRCSVAQHRCRAVPLGYTLPVATGSMAFLTHLGPLRGLQPMELLFLLLPVAVLLLLAEPRLFRLEAIHFLALRLGIVSPLSHLFTTTETTTKRFTIHFLNCIFLLQP